MRLAVRCECGSLVIGVLFIFVHALASFGVFVLREFVELVFDFYAFRASVGVFLRFWSVSSCVVFLKINCAKWGLDVSIFAQFIFMVNKRGGLDGCTKPLTFQILTGRVRLRRVLWMHGNR